MVARVALRPVQLNVKARDNAELGRFWAEALNWRTSSATPGATPVQPEGFVWPNPATVTIDVIAVPDPETVQDRIHLDLATTSVTHQTELVTRLKTLGATPANIGQGDVPWTVLADPEGNVFCVLEPRTMYRETGPIAAIVVNCTDPRAMTHFWSKALDWPLHEASEDHASLRSATGTGPYLEFRHTPNPNAIRNRIHLDLAPYPSDDQLTEVTRLKTLGATDADVGQGNAPWKCLTDPEGNQFCVLTPS